MVICFLSGRCSYPRSRSNQEKSVTSCVKIGDTEELKSLLQTNAFSSSPSYFILLENFETSCSYIEVARQAFHTWYVFSQKTISPQALLFFYPVKLKQTDRACSKALENRRNYFDEVNTQSLSRQTKSNDDRILGIRAAGAHRATRRCQGGSQRLHPSVLPYLGSMPVRLYRNHCAEPQSIKRLPPRTRAQSRR